jgi:hypothetical protein
VPINIHIHVPVTLTADDSDSWQWCSFFELKFKKFGLINHVDGTVDTAAMIDNPEWIQINSYIVSWLYSTMSKEIDLERHLQAP